MVMRKPAVGEYRRGIGSIIDPDSIRRDFRHETMTVDEHRHLRMIVYFADEGTAQPGT